jgi:hypothetical protein
MTQPLRPLTQEELNEMELGRLLKKLSGHPQTRRETYKLLKKANPNARFIDQELEDYKEAEAKRREDEKLERERQAVMTRLENERKALAERYDEEHIKEIEALMQKHGISSYEIGAKLYASEVAPSRGSSSNPQGQTWTMPDNKDLLADPRKWATDQAANIIEEFKRNQRLSR